MADIILKDASGTDQTYTGVNSVSFRTTTEGETATFITQQQADWNQEDEAAVDYIKNKPQDLATKTYVQEQMDAIGIQEDVATKEYVQEQIANIEIPSSQIPSDWDQTDSTANDFIKNRPFGLLQDNLAERELTFRQEDGVYRCDIAQDQPIVIGETYKVTWDGTTYELVAKDQKDISTGSSQVEFESSPYLGNSYIVGVCWGMTDWGEDTGEPFVISVDALASNSVCISTTDLTKATHTISVVAVNNKKKLSAEWLPDGIATEDFVKEQIAAIEIPEGGGGISTEETILEERTLEESYPNDSYDGVYCSYITPTPFTLIAGEQYLVCWDGISYKCKAQDATALIQGAVFIGNAVAFGFEGNNEPFLIGGTLDAGGTCNFLCLTDDEPTVHTVAICHQTPLSVSWKNVTDKPFGEEIVTIFEGTFQDTLMDNDGDGVNDAWEGEMLLEDSSDATLVLGQTYNVTFDGVEYEFVCESYQGLPYVGSSAFTTGVPDDIPFIIMRDAAGIMGDGQVWALMFIPPPTDLTISGKYDVKITSGGIKCLDNKYLSILENDGEELIPETMMELTYQSSEELNLWAGSPQTITEATYHALYSKAGEQVLVMFDGAEYFCNVLLEDGSSPMILLGNFSIFPSAPVEDTGEPFFLMIQRTGTEGSYEYVWNIGTNDPAPADTSVTIEHTVGVILNPGYKIKDEYLSILEESVKEERTVLVPLDENMPLNTLHPTYNIYFVATSIDSPLVIGETYEVVWDNATYRCIAQDTSSIGEGGIIIGNASSFGLEGNDEPFVLMTEVGGTSILIASLTATEPVTIASFSLTQITSALISVISESYIPDSVKLPAATTEDNNKFLRIVDGVPTWVSLTDVSTEGA